jgi:hypothetical protein
MGSSEAIDPRAPAELGGDHGQSGPIHHECHGVRSGLWFPSISSLRVGSSTRHHRRAASAAAYMLYFAFRIANRTTAQRVRELRAVPALWGGFMLAIANPKAYLAIGAVFAGTSLFADHAFACRR